MFFKRNKKDTLRYNGIDIQPWKVVDIHGHEYYVIRKDAEGFEYIVDRWNGFKPANAVARRLGGYAVRA